MPQKNIVEVAARTDDGLTPLGIMNTEQAQALPDGLDIVVSHQDEERAMTDTDQRLVDQSEPLR